MLERVRDGIAGREAVPHPGPFGAWRAGKPPSDALQHFDDLFRAAGGELVHVPDFPAAARWIAEFAGDFATVTVGVGVPSELRPERPAAAPRDAALGLSMARGAVAETGSLILDARDGRRTQLLAPTHVVVLERDAIYNELREALTGMKHDLPSALGFHSGPSKSADIGQIMVKGVHGPGRVIALVIGPDVEEDS